MKYVCLIIVNVMLAILPPMACADATVRLNNYDSLMPVYWREVGKLASGDDFYVEVFGGPLGSAWNGLLPITPVGATSPIIKLKEPGYFDAGIGVFPYPYGVLDNRPVTLGVRGWYGAPTFEEGSFWFNSGLTPVWNQLAGSWDPKSGLAPTGPSLAMPRPLVIGFEIPEPSTVTLAILGGGLLLLGSRKKNGHYKQWGAVR